MSSVDKDILIKGIETIQNVISVKATLPILSNFLLEAGKNGLRLTATDLNIGISCVIPVDIQEPGAITIPARRFSGIIKELSDNEVTITTKKNNMVIIETPAAYLPEEYLVALGISEGESLYHLYAHMQSSPLVQLGDEVECGQPLGVVGMIGYNIVNPHLHLETRIGPSNTQFIEMAFYTTSATLEEMDSYKYWRTSGEFRHFDPMDLFSLYIQ